MSFYVQTPTECVCALPDAIKDINDMEISGTSTDAQNELLEAAKAAAKDLIEGGSIGVPTSTEDAPATGYRVSISGHVGETPGLGDSLSISISAAVPTLPESSEGTPEEKPSSPELEAQEVQKETV